MKILITGANGLLGANLCTMYAGENEVIATDIFIPDFPRCKNSKLDITKKNDLKILKQIKPDVIINCAALVNVDDCEAHRDDAFRVNCEGTRNLARETNRALAGGCYFVHISTDAVFDGHCGYYGEEAKTNPVNIYGESKLCAEKSVIKEYKENSTYAIIRTNIFGWNRLDKESLAEWIIHRLENNEKVPAFKDILFSPILVNNLGEIILELYKMKYSGIINIAGNNGFSKLEFAYQIAAAFGLNKGLICPASVEDLKRKAKRPRNMILDVSKARRLLKTKILDVANGIKRLKELKDEGYIDELKMKNGA